MIKRLPLFIFAFICAASTAQAHPHAWIDYATKLELNQKNEIIALQETWIFDEYYTALALSNFDTNNDGKLSKKELLTLGTENLKNLKTYNYFTYIPINGKDISFSKISNISSTLKKGRITLSFTLTPPKPIPLQKEIIYRIYDPSYYTSMQHTKKQSISFIGEKSNQCKYDLFTPKPDIMKIKFAASLSMDVKAPEQLGRHFAQKVTLSCK